MQGPLPGRDLHISKHEDRVQMQNERLVSIETKLSFQEQIADQLSEVLRDQQAQLDTLKQTIERLSERLGHAEKNGAGDPPTDEKPPHY